MCWFDGGWLGRGVEKIDEYGWDFGSLFCFCIIFVVYGYFEELGILVSEYVYYVGVFGDLGWDWGW